MRAPQHRPALVVLLAALTLSLPAGLGLTGYTTDLYTLEQTIAPPDTASADDFGWAIAADGDTLVVGEPRNSEETFRGGAVHIYERQGTGWNWLQTLRIDGLQPYDKFGYDVAIDGDRIAVGSWGHDGVPRSGAAYVFEFIDGDWSQVATLLPPDPDETNHFGTRLSISGDWALVGAYSDDGDRGAVHAFRWNGSGWNLVQKIGPSVLEPGAGIGLEVDIASGLAALGSNSGAFVYELVDGSWIQTAHITGETTNPPDERFGCCFDFDGERLVIQSNSGVLFDIYRALPQSEEEVLRMGSVHIFQRRNAEWIQTDTLYPPFPVKRFANSVALDGDRIAIGAVLEPGQRRIEVPIVREHIATVGKVEAFFVFERGADGSWNHTFTVDQARPIGSDGFRPAAWSDGNLLVKAPFAEEGRVYEYVEFKNSGRLEP